jgi:transposase
VFTFDAAAARAHELPPSLDAIVGTTHEPAAQRHALRLVAPASTRLVFLDESGVNNRTGQRRYGYAPRGASVRPLRRYRRTRNRSMLVVVVSQARDEAPLARDACGIVARRVVAGGFNRERFVAFLREVLAPALRQLPPLAPVAGARTLLIMDNASMHKGAAVEAAVAEALPGVELCYLAPYSPTFNPCENAFAKTKRALARRRWDSIVPGDGAQRLEPSAEADAALERCIHAALDEVTQHDVEAWARMCGYNR